MNIDQTKDPNKHWSTMDPQQLQNANSFQGGLDMDRKYAHINMNANSMGNIMFKQGQPLSNHTMTSGFYHFLSNKKIPSSLTI